MGQGKAASYPSRFRRNHSRRERNGDDGAGQIRLDMGVGSSLQCGPSGGNAA